MGRFTRVKKLLTYALVVVAAVCAAAGQVSAQAWKAHGVPLFVSASHPSGHEGFVRVINHSDEAGEVLIDAVDDEGVPYGPVTFSIGAGETVHFNSGDLEEGNADRGLSRGIGAGDGDWRLRLRSQLDLEVLAYNRTSDGLLAPLNDLVPSAVVRRPSTGEEAMGYRVVVFNPASNVDQVSRLRIINRGEEEATVTIEGIDDDGVSPGTAVELEVPAGVSRTVTSQELESGQGEGLAGMLDDGKGKWQLVVTADQPIEVMSLLSSPTGHLTNLSTEPGTGEEGAGVHDVPLFAAAVNADNYQGFVRVINHSDTSGEVSIEAFDDAGAAYGPVTLYIGANETVHFNSGDLEEGNAEKGLADGIGDGDRRLRLSSDLDLDLEVLAYNRTHDGLLTTLHDLVPYTEVVRPGGEEVQGHDVAIFNPASNVDQVSHLRVINSGAEAATVVIEGIDDDGASPGTAVELTVPAGASRTLASQALESGQWDAGIEASGRLGDGKGKWRLAVTSEQTIQVMSLLSSPTGHLVNLSTAAPGGVAVPPPVVPTYAAIEVTGRSTASIGGRPVALSVKSVGTSDVAIERYEWVFSDGQRESGDEVSVTFAEAGVHDVTVSAMSGTDAVAQARWAVAVFDADAGANPGFEGIPKIFGDVNGDGRFGRDDLELAEQAVAGTAVLEPESLDAADLDLSGGLEERDVELMRQALDSGAALPSALLEESAYPGGVVAMVSPGLLDADIDVEVFVDGVPSPQVMRAILGYATFEVPVSLTGQDAEVEVVLEADGTVTERLRLLLKRSPDIPAVNAKEDVLAFLAELAELITDQQQAGADFVEQNGGLSADDTAIVLGVADAAALQLEAATAELKVLLDGEGGEELATILQTALYANGLVEFRESLRTGPESIGAKVATGSEISPSVAAVCDKYVPVICKLKKIDTGFSYGATAAAALCTASGLASAVALVPSGGKSGILFAYVVKFCTPVAVALEITTTLSGLIEEITLSMRLTTDKDVLTKTGDTATITAEVTFFGLKELCHKESTANVSDRFAGGINKRIAKLMLRKSKRLDRVKRIAEKLGKSQTAFFFMAIENAVGQTLTRIRLDLAFQAAADMLCEYLDADTAGERNFVGIPADGNEFSLVASAGTQRLSTKEFAAKDDGTYRLSCPANYAGTLTVDGGKELCGRPKKDTVRVSCKGVPCDGSADTVNIQDANLRAAVEERLGKVAGESITPAEMATLSYLRAVDRGIGSLTGLECATGLKTLDVRSGQISDVSPLSGLPALTTLYLDRNRISDVSPLSGLPTLTTLHITSNLITDVSPLSDLPALKQLLFLGNPISTLSLSDLPSLTSLSFRDGRPTRVSLSGLPALESIGLGYNQISSSGLSLSDLPNLKGLNLQNNQLSDLTPLSGLKTLERLKLTNNQISDVSQLSGLTALENLDLSSNEISNIGPLVSNAGLGRGDYLDLLQNPLSKTSQCTHIPALGQRGVRINYSTFFRPECD